MNDIATDKSIINDVCACQIRRCIFGDQLIGKSKLSEQ